MKKSGFSRYTNCCAAKVKVPTLKFSGRGGMSLGAAPPVGMRHVRTTPQGNKMAAPMVRPASRSPWARAASARG